MSDPSKRTATAIANSNIALIKYWGNRDDSLRLPANGSISMNLEGLFTRTRVKWDEGRVTGDELRVTSDELRGTWSVEGGARRDALTINGQIVSGPGLQRVSAFLDIVRGMAGITLAAQVDSENNFPAGAGIASSAAAFAALALAASQAAGMDLSAAALSRLARRGSGSACRSIPGGFVEWQVGTDDEDSFAFSIAPPEHWALTDCIAVVSAEHKATGSTQGHAIAGTSPLQAARLANAARRLDLCRRAIQERDFEALAAVSELDSNLMHAVMMTSTPPLFYWQPATLTVMARVRLWRGEGLPVCYTLDAGPNVHVLTEAVRAGQVADLLHGVPGVQEVRVARVGGPARLVA
jgi:diphosphomevalonate decarboxylase